jgi:RNA polymerase sigma-70 factor, ECF subfamily
MGSYIAQQDKNHVVEIVRKAIEGDTVAFGQLYTNHITPIFRFVYFRVNNRADAEDLTQTVFLKAWNALPKFQEKGGSFLSWLYKIARNTVIDHWKKKKEVSVSDPATMFGLVEDPTESPAESLDKSNFIDRIRKSIKNLSDDQQEIIVLKFIEELTNKEISDLTGKSEDAIRALQYRGLRGLRGYLKNHD